MPCRKSVLSSVNDLHLNFLCTFNDGAERGNPFVNRNPDGSDYNNPKCVSPVHCASSYWFMLCKALGTRKGKGGCSGIHQCPCIKKSDMDSNCFVQLPATTGLCCACSYL